MPGAPSTSSRPEIPTPVGALTTGPCQRGQDRCGHTGSMLAILAGKLDPAAGTVSDRSEDALTDAVFGAIRHLPYRRVLGAVLAAVGGVLPVPANPDTSVPPATQPAQRSGYCRKPADTATPTSAVRPG